MTFIYYGHGFDNLPDFLLPEGFIILLFRKFREIFINFTKIPEIFFIIKGVRLLSGSFVITVHLPYSIIINTPDKWKHPFFSPLIRI